MGRSGPPGGQGQLRSHRNLGGGLMKGGTSGAVTRSKQRSCGWHPGILRASRYLHRRHSLSAFTSWSTSPGSLKRFSCDSRMRAGSPPLSTRNKSDHKQRGQGWAVVNLCNYYLKPGTKVGGQKSSICGALTTKKFLSFQLFLG